MNPVLKGQISEAAKALGGRGPGALLQPVNKLMTWAVVREEAGPVIISQNLDSRAVDLYKADLPASPASPRTRTDRRSCHTHYSELSRLRNLRLHPSPVDRSG